MLNPSIFAKFLHFCRKVKETTEQVDAEEGRQGYEDQPAHTRVEIEFLEQFLPGLGEIAQLHKLENANDPHKSI